TQLDARTQHDALAAGTRMSDRHAADVALRCAMSPLPPFTDPPSLPLRAPRPLWRRMRAPAALLAPVSASRRDPGLPHRAAPCAPVALPPPCPRRSTGSGA